jgi:hypothetical protein
MKLSCNSITLDAAHPDAVPVRFLNANHIAIGSPSSRCFSAFGLFSGRRFRTFTAAAFADSFSTGKKSPHGSKSGVEISVRWTLHPPRHRRM